MPCRSGHVQEERPAVELAVDAAFCANRGDNVVDHVFRDVVVPRFDNAGLDEGRHLHKRRLPDIDVPGALAVLGLGDKALNAETLDWGDLIVDSGEPGVHRWDGGVKVLDPLVERRREGTVRRECRPNARLRHSANAGQTQPRKEAAGKEFASVDASLGKLAARRFLKKALLFTPFTHVLLPPLWRVPASRAKLRPASMPARVRSAMQDRRQSFMQIGPKCRVILNPQVRASTICR